MTRIGRTPTRRARTVTALAGAALLVGGLAACSDDDEPTAASTPSGTVTSSEDASPTSATSPGTPTEEATGTATGSPAASRPRDCRTSDLRVGLRDLDSAPGRRYAEIVLTNATGQACTVEGFGGMQLLDSSRNPVPTRVVRMVRPAARPVVLQPGDVAASEISFSVVATDDDATRGPCQPVPAYVLVTPPDQRRSTRVPWNLGPACDRGRVEQKAYQASQP